MVTPQHTFIMLSWLAHNTFLLCYHGYPTTHFYYVIMVRTQHTFIMLSWLEQKNTDKI